MKKIILVSLIFLGIVLSCFTVQAMLNRHAQELLTEITGIQHLVTQDNWVQADRDFGKLHADWDKKAFWWSMLLNHSEVDEIHLVFSELQALFASGPPGEAKSDISANLNALTFWISHVSRKGNLNPPNFF